jgi:hypothetical protein
MTNKPNIDQEVTKSTNKGGFDSLCTQLFLCKCIPDKLLQLTKTCIYIRGTTDQIDIYV